MTDRDDLAALIAEHLDASAGTLLSGSPCVSDVALADAILAKFVIFEPIDPMDDEYDRTEVWVRGKLRNNMGTPNVTLTESDHPRPVEAWMRHQDPREEPHYYRKAG